MHAAMKVFLAGSASLVLSASAQTCSLGQGVDGVTLFDYPSFAPTVPTSLFLTGSASLSNSQLVLAVDEPNGGVVGYAWHPTRERIGDGFESTFTYNVGNKANAGDGFTYFIQNYQTSDLNGGTGDKLGSFGIPRSVAVKFDICANRPACTVQTVRILVTDADNNPATNALYTFGSSSPLLAANALTASGADHVVKVTYDGRYKGSNAQVRVTFDNTEILTLVVGDLTDATRFGSRFAFFGFTASTSWSQTAQIQVKSWKTVMMPSDWAVTDFNLNKPLRFEYGTVAVVKVFRRDSCKSPINSALPANITATLFQIPAPVDPLDWVTLYGNSTNNGDGSFSISWQLPQYYIGSFDLSILIDNIKPEGFDVTGVWPGGVETYKPSPAFGGLPLWALILLILFILFIILLLAYVIYRLHRYRQKLEKNKEFIEAGKKQAELDRLEDGTTYAANPLVGTVDDLKTQLAKNEEELAQLRKREAAGEDQDYTIEQLQKKRDELLNDLTRMKKAEQEAELDRATATGYTGTGAKTKKEFGRQNI